LLFFSLPPAPPPGRRAAPPRILVVPVPIGSGCGAGGRCRPIRSPWSSVIPSPGLVRGQSCTGCLRHSESSSPRRPRAVARVAGGVSAATGPGRTAGARKATSALRAEKRGHPKVNCSGPWQPRHGARRDTKKRGERNRNGERMTTLPASRIPHFGASWLDQLFILARALARAFCAADKPSPPLSLPRSPLPARRAAARFKTS
jgi:hypothetical protein